MKYSNQAPRTPRPPLIAVGILLILLSTCLSSDCNAEYLQSAEMPPPSSILSPPPAAGSAADERDLLALKELQKSRLKADCDRAASEVSASFGSFYGPPYGPLKRDEINRLNDFFEKIRNEAKAVIVSQKQYWKRPRPYLSHNEIAPCIKKETTFSYPSGHATLARLDARILSKIYPKLKTALMTRANELAKDRPLAGVHYPSDIQAGKTLGDKLFEMLEQNLSFKKDLERLLTQ